MPDPWYYSNQPPSEPPRPHPPTERVPWAPARYSQTRHLEEIGPRLPAPPPAPPTFDARDPWAASAQAPAPGFSPAPLRYQPPAGPPPQQRYQPAPAPQWQQQPWQQQPWQPPRPRRKRRVFLWVFLAIQALFIILIALQVGAHPAGPTAAQQAAQQCAGNGWYPLFKSQADCQVHFGHALNTATDVGKGIGVVVIVVIWMVVDFFVGLGYGIYRLASRR